MSTPHPPAAQLELRYNRPWLVWIVLLAAIPVMAGGTVLFLRNGPGHGAPPLLQWAVLLVFWLLLAGFLHHGLRMEATRFSLAPDGSATLQRRRVTGRRIEESLPPGSITGIEELRNPSGPSTGWQIHLRLADGRRVTVQDQTNPDRHDDALLRLRQGLGLG